MATIAQLEAEPWWGREIVTSPMIGLGLQLRGAYGTGAVSVGIKGNAAHLSGGHRSQEWIKNSRYCTSRSYATQANLAGEQLRYCAALDFTPGAWGTADNRAKMRVLTRRAVDAMRAGQCDELVEVFGTLDGRTVTGWRNDENRWASADSSHLDHLHLRFDRRYANDNAVMSTVAAILLEDDVSKAEVIDALDDPVGYTSGGVAAWAKANGWGPVSARALLEYTLVATQQTIPQLAQDVAELKARPAPAATIDTAALVAELAAALEPKIEAAAEAAVRKVLGAVDGATPAEA